MPPQLRVPAAAALTCVSSLAACVLTPQTSLSCCSILTSPATPGLLTFIESGDKPEANQPPGLNVALRFYQARRNDARPFVPTGRPRRHKQSADSTTISSSPLLSRSSSRPQKQSLQFMLDAERLGTNRLLWTRVPCPGQGGRAVWRSLLTGQWRFSPPQDLRGGFLCEGARARSPRRCLLGRCSRWLLLSCSGCAAGINAATGI